MMRKTWLGLLLSVWACTATAEDIYRVNNWDVDGRHGLLHVKGTLTDSACRLSMNSAWQVVALGNLGTGQLQQVGQRGTPVAVNLVLEDCLSGESRSRSTLGNVVWSPDMPSMKLRFLGPIVANRPDLVAVRGVKGIGLALSDGRHMPLTPGESSTPVLLEPGNNRLTYYITPVRLSTGLKSGAFQADIRFLLIYD